MEEPRTEMCFSHWPLTTYVYVGFLFNHQWKTLSSSKRAQAQPASKEGFGGRGRSIGEQRKEESPWENQIHIIGRPSLQALWDPEDCSQAGLHVRAQHCLPEEAVQWWNKSSFICLGSSLHSVTAPDLKKLSLELASFLDKWGDLLLSQDFFN